MDAVQLLNQLASAGRLAGVGVRTEEPRRLLGGTEQASFAELLERAREGGLATYAPVSVREDAGVVLNEEQLARLSVAADRAEAAGLRKALVLVDGQRLVLDVQSREVVGATSAEEGLVAGVDGVIDLGHGATGGSGTIATPSAGLVGNLSLAKLLEGIGKR